MNCRRVNWLAADWAAGKLPKAEAEAVDSHRARCASCARLLRTEEALRRDWSKAREPEVGEVDLWPRLSPRLEPRRRVAPVPRLIWAGAAALVIVATAALHPWPRSNGRPVPAVIGAANTAPALVSQGAPMEALASWSGTNDEAMANPAVDDPAGTAMEEIWTHIKSGKQ